MACCTRTMSSLPTVGIFHSSMVEEVPYFLGLLLQAFLRPSCGAEHLLPFAPRYSNGVFKRTSARLAGRSPSLRALGATSRLFMLAGTERGPADSVLSEGMPPMSDTAINVWHWSELSYYPSS